MLGYIIFIMALLHSSNDSTRVLKSVEEDALELGDLERQESNVSYTCTLRNIFLDPQGIFILLLLVFTVSS